jgi:hypothetical protein
MLFPKRMRETKHTLNSGKYRYHEGIREFSGINLAYASLFDNK